MKSVWIATVLFVGVTVASAGDFEDRQKLAGTWQQTGDTAHTWTLAGTDEAMTVTETEKGEKVREFQCNTFGKECDVKERGKHAKISMWFNGPSLVAMETRGNEVLKRRFQVSGDGNALHMEVIPIAPAGKTEALDLKRVSAQ